VNLNLSNSSWNIRTIFRNKQQIKGRNFEVPGCGSLLLTDAVPRLDEYYCIDKEVVCFRSSKELTEKIRYYLSHDDEREAIAAAGYARTLKEHTYERRFIDIFDKMNFDI
jgi:spore maturation protein CgeB